MDTEKALVLGLSIQEINLLVSIHKQLTAPSATQPTTSSPANMMTILELSKTASIPRTTLYYMLEKLKERKLVVRKKLNKKFYWILGDASEVLFPKKELGPNHPDTTGFSPAPNSHVEFLFGEDMMKVLENIALLPKNKRIYGIQPEQSLLSAIKNGGHERFLHVNETIKRKNIIVEAIVHEHAFEHIIPLLSKGEIAPLLKSISGRLADTSGIPNDYLSTTNAEIYLYDDVVSIINWQAGFGITIRDKNVFGLIFELFKSLKYMLKKYDQNDKIARMLVEMENDRGVERGSDKVKKIKK